MLVRVATVGLVAGALTGCSPAGGAGSSAWAAWVEARERTAQFFCQCAIEDGLTEISLSQCIDDEVHPPASEQLACREGVLADDDAARRVVECWTEAEVTYEACVAAEGCPDGGPTPFTCGSGEQVAAAQRCDGFEHCEDGSDEVDCPPPHPCGDGSTVPSAWVCDGFDDCPDAEDEEGCPATCAGDRNDATTNCGDLDEPVATALSACD